MMNDKTLHVTCRDSALSLLQVKEALSLFPSISCRIFPIQSFGDKNKQISLMENIAPDFFTRELDLALIRGEADIAVHSAKDLPYPLSPELALFALLDAFDKTDALVSRNKQTLAQLPSGAKVGTSSATRKAELLSCRPDLEVVSVRGTIEERIAQVDKGFIDALIVATCALKRLGLTGRIAEILPFKTHPLQGNLAIVGRKDRSDIKMQFSGEDISNHYGKVQLVGFGPGNPDLLTIGGDKALAGADVIFHDDLLDRTFLSRYPGEKVYVGKRKDIHRFHQDEINELVYQAAISGKNTVRLKGGDPMIFAHGREEIDFLQSRFVEVAVIPGVSAGNAFAAYTHIPLTHRGLASSVAFTTGHSDKNRSVPLADTLVYYMGGANLSAIAGNLMVAGRPEDTPVALAYNVSLPDQKIWFSTLKELKHSIVKYPTPILLVVGEVVGFESQQTANQRVLVTGTNAEEYKNAGTVTHTPLIKIEKIENNRTLHHAIGQLHAYDWIIFTSRYGVRYFFETFSESQSDIRGLANTKLASVGKTTSAELGKYHVYPDLESATGSAKGLVEYFRENRLTGKKILLPRSDKGLKDLSEALIRLGNTLTDIPVYRNRVNEQAAETDLRLFGKIIFTSPSGVEAFAERYGEMPEGIQLISKGETTAEKLKTYL
ncbi:MAG: uroporphyrinogen-III C-methyltransferase [Dysgonamonadaceae bacterium]|jgi:uroporphyrinogen III methyltransferase/synthase|nr:uroporphyrinogen-III C-methyltransferase [Dysgonamonadaceae bacterium]